MGEFYYRTRIIDNKKYKVRESKEKAKQRANDRYKLKTEELKRKSAERYELKKDEINEKLKQKRIELKPDKYCKVCEILIHKSKNINSRYCSIKCKSKNSYIKNGHGWLEQKRKYKRNKYNTDVMQNLKERMRGRLNSFFKYKNLTKSKKTIEILGCEWGILKIHIEKQFKDGMNWENRELWHVDHIIPLASAKNEQELIKLCHYTNLQPLWAEENLKKGSK